MTLTTRVTARVEATHTSGLDLATVSDPLDFLRRIELASGTGASQADQVWHDQRTLSASASEDLDFAGSLADAFGSTLTFARIKLLAVYAAAANTNNVVVTQDSSAGVAGIFTGASEGVSVRPGGIFLWVAPDATAAAVTATSADLITFTNSSSGTSVTYDVVVIGASA